MRIAVTSQNFKTITGHAGKSRRFIVYDVDGSAPPVEAERLDLSSGMSIHDYHGEDHPLFQLGLNALITQSAGAGFMQRMARHGISVHATSEPDPQRAVAQLAAGAPLAAALPHEDDHDHHHHDHRHDHADQHHPAQVRLQVGKP
ncbi:NifB/NifX family molybdenum-iron cluster-binding protein [Thiobaca trueperi]|uniref:Putative Fe-Mo cluster-binding NifX family protein n=1 Tax=Thiobaca trueperi TaxID=127458 RepID=A0A4R3MXJ3_9GAMM|nr:NifB/NifX family molybdenum-iron cluster-binding protein [Thiobaca trueperi]TCT20286.1 putative Fe-Mo cluster-binding NifX family protein [Thiobaca trueperi]